MFDKLLDGFSIEVMPRTLQKVENLEQLFPEKTRVYIAHIEGVAFSDMLATAKRLSGLNYRVMPHFPARIIENKTVLQDWVKAYVEEAGVSEALLLAGSPRSAIGTLDNSMELLETEIFDKFGFKRLHIAGHPEGNRDIEPESSGQKITEALEWKQLFSERTDADMAIVTQFAFSADLVVEWAASLKEKKIDLPIHVGVAGPTKLQTLIKFAVSCGVGPSLKVLQKRATDLSKLLLPYEPTEVLGDLETLLGDSKTTNITNIHFFPLGGIQATAEWITGRLDLAA